MPNIKDAPMVIVQLSYFFKALGWRDNRNSLDRWFLGNGLCLTLTEQMTECRRAAILLMNQKQNTL